MAVLRDAIGPVGAAELEQAWPADPAQRERALDSLVADGLVEPVGTKSYGLPVSEPAG
jgi:A/G-specific adenine glycosylase